MKIIIGLLVAGVALAIVIGFAGSSQSVAERQFCRSLEDFSSSLQSLTSLDASASQDDFQSAASDVRNSWTDVKGQAQSLGNANLNALNESWDAFAQTLKSAGGSASVSDAEKSISSAADELQSTVTSNQQSYDCTNSS